MTIKQLNTMAFGFLGGAKLMALISVVLMLTDHRIISGSLLIASGLLLITTVILSLTAMKKQNAIPWVPISGAIYPSVEADGILAKRS